MNSKESDMLATMDINSCIANSQQTVITDFFGITVDGVVSPSGKPVARQLSSPVEVFTVSTSFNNQSFVGATWFFTSLPDPVFNYDLAEMQMAMSSGVVDIPDDIEDFDFFENWLEQFK